MHIMIFIFSSSTYHQPEALLLFQYYCQSDIERPQVSFPTSFHQDVIVDHRKSSSPIHYYYYSTVLTVCYVSTGKDHCSCGVPVVNQIEQQEIQGANRDILNVIAGLKD